MVRVSRPTEGAVLQALRRELEPHGFRYKARKVIKQSDLQRIMVYLFRARWIKPEDEVFTVLVEFEALCVDGDKGGTVLSLADAARAGLFYGESRSRDKPEHVEPGEVIGDFRRTMLPVILANPSPESFTKALLADEFAPGVPHYLSMLDRVHQAYSWAKCLQANNIANQAVNVMRELAANPSEREAVLFAWKTLELPGSPV